MMLSSVAAFEVSGVVVFVVPMMPFDVVGDVAIVVSVKISDLVGVFKGCVLVEGECMAKKISLTLLP